MKILLTFLLCVFLSHAAVGDSLPIPSTGISIEIVTEDFPPYNYETAKGAEGLSSEVVKAALREANIKANITFYPWARAYELAKVRKDTLIYSIARIPERESLFHWVGIIAPYNTSIYKLRERTDITIQSLDQINQYTVGVSRADVISQYLRRKGVANLMEVNRDIQNLHKLYRSRVDLIAYDEASFKQQIDQENLDPKKFERIFRLTEISDNMYMAFSLQTDISIVEKLKAALERIRKNGVIERIHKKYAL